MKRFSVKDMPNTVRMLRLYHVLEDGYSDSTCSLEFVRNEKADVRTCEMRVDDTVYKIFYDQHDPHFIGCTENCEKDAAEFLARVAANLYEKVTNDEAHPEFEYFEVEESRWRVAKKLKLLIEILPFSNPIARKEEGN